MSLREFLLKKIRIHVHLGAMALALSASSAMAATVDPSDFSLLMAEAQKNGAAAVAVHLAPTTLQQLQDNLGAVKADMSVRSTRLLSELGTATWEGGRWNNGIGQMGLYVTPAGLQHLQQTNNAVSFRPDIGWINRIRSSDTDGRHAQIERQLSNHGFVDVTVTMSVEGLEYELTRQGDVRHLSSSAQVGEARAKARTLFGELTDSQAIGKAAALARLDSLVAAAASSVAPEVTVRVDRQGLIKLSESGLVRNLRPANFKDTRAVRFDMDALKSAQANGYADVILTVKTPYSGGESSAESFTANVRSNRRTIDALWADHGLTSKLKDLSIFGAVAGRLTRAELETLYRSSDARLLSIELNRAAGYASLNKSSVLVNMPSAWTAGFRAAGQNIVVMDTGVLASHQFFKDAAGVSRVKLEACFGTNSPPSGTLFEGKAYHYESICPSQGTAGAAEGDSPVGLAGSAAPRLNCAGNSSPLATSCHHGTHVAGIAAGRRPSNLAPTSQGMAPDANIIAVQVFSFDIARVDEPTAFKADLIAAMQAAANAMPVGSTGNPFTVNLSLASNGSTNSGFAASCPNENTAFTAAVQTLFNAGVPVVAAVGNNSFNGRVSWPACVPRVIKVAAVNNDTVGNTRSTFSNLADPASYAGDFMWLAPGGGGTTSVTSSFNAVLPGGAIPYSWMSGTSQAAPHITGIYAVIKAGIPGISVNDANAWIRENASVIVPIVVGSRSINFRRVRIPL
jgi:subtilisin family serine protease